MDEKRIEQIMTSLHCSRDEAINVLQDDEKIDNGEELFELTEEQKKASKQARRSVGVKRSAPAHRERKVDEVKGSILAACKNVIIQQGANITGEQTETELHFALNGVNYTLKLTKHREPKK